jgi:hypothetical protein
MLSGIENPLPIIMEDLNIRADRLANQLTTTTNSHNNSYKKLILRWVYYTQSKDSTRGKIRLEIRKIYEQARRDKTVGAVEPTDITIAYEVLKQALELATYGIEVGTFCYLAYDKIKEKFKKPVKTARRVLLTTKYWKWSKRWRMILKPLK